MCSLFLLNNFSSVAWQLTLARPEKQKEAEGKEGEGDLCILIFQSVISSEKAVSLHFSSLCNYPLMKFLLSLCSSSIPLVTNFWYEIFLLVSLNYCRKLNS